MGVKGVTAQTRPHSVGNCLRGQNVGKPHVLPWSTDQMTERLILLGCTLRTGSYPCLGDDGQNIGPLQNSRATGPTLSNQGNRGANQPYGGMV